MNSNPAAVIARAPDALASDRPTWLDEREFPFRSRFVDVEDARLHYVDEGVGPTLLLLHGSPMWSFMFRALIAALGDRYRCVAVDLPGLGLSTAPIARGRAFERNAQLLTGFVERLGLGGVTLFAHATAGPSAAAMAVGDPARFERLIVSNTFAWSLMEERKLRAFVRIVSSRPFGFVNVNLNLLPRLTARLARRTGRMSAGERAAVLGPYRTRAARRQLQNLLYSVRAQDEFLRALEPKLAELRHMPALLLFGELDNGYRAGFADRWRRALPRSETVVIDGAMHFPLEDDPRRCIDAVAHFLAETQ